MAQKDLIPFSNRTEDERKKISEKAGKKSGEARRLKKSLRETAIALLDSNIVVDKLPKKVKVGLALLPKVSKKDKVKLQTIALLGQVLGMASGNDRCARYISDLISETTPQDQELAKVDRILSELNSAMRN